MFDCDCFLYVAPVNDKENSIERQMKSAKQFAQKCAFGNYKAVVTENEKEMIKPITEREGFLNFLNCYCDENKERPVLVMDITVLNGMDFSGLRKLQLYAPCTEIVIISESRFVSNYGIHRPCPQLELHFGEPFNMEDKNTCRNFENVIVYCCIPSDKSNLFVSQFITSEIFSSLAIGVRKLSVYAEKGKNSSVAIGNRTEYKIFLEEIKAGNYDIAFTFEEAFWKDELEGVMCEIRKHMPLILIDMYGRFTYLEKAE